MRSAAAVAASHHLSNVPVSSQAVPREPHFYVLIFFDIQKESAPMQLAYCWFLSMAVSDAKIRIHFSNKIHGSNFIKQQSETVMV